MNRLVASGPAASSDFACVSSAWQAHEGELLGYLRHRLSDADAADDVLQDVFVKAMRHGQGFCTLETQREFADAHGLSLPATKSRLLRARQRLRNRLTTACQVRFESDGSVAGHVPRPPVV